MLHPILSNPAVTSTCDSQSYDIYLPGREESCSKENVSQEDKEAGGDGDGDQGEVLNQLELDGVVHVAH